MYRSLDVQNNTTTFAPNNLKFPKFLKLLSIAARTHYEFALIILLPAAAVLGDAAVAETRVETCYLWELEVGDSHQLSTCWANYDFALELDAKTLAEEFAFDLVCRSASIAVPTGL